MSQFGRSLSFDARRNVSKCCNQLWQEAQHHADGEGTGSRVEICFLGAQSDKTVENADTDKGEGETDG